MELKFRIKKRGDEYWPQVKKEYFGFIGVWRTIVNHNDGYGLYPNNHFGYPKSKNESVLICRRFTRWFNKQNCICEYEYLN